MAAKSTLDLLQEIDEIKAQARTIQDEVNNRPLSSAAQNVTGHAIAQKDRLKTQVDEAKTRLVNLQVKFHMMTLALGEKDSLTEEEVVQKKASADAKYSQAKSEVKAKKSSIIKLAENVENYYEQVQSKSSQLQTKISQLEQNQAKISVLKERNCLNNEKQSHADIKISKAKAKLEDTKCEVLRTRQEIEDRKHEAAISRHRLTDMSNEIDIKTDIEMVEKNDDCLEWMNSLSKTLTKMSGIESCFVDGNLLEINFQAPVSQTHARLDEATDSEHSAPSLQLTATFKKVRSALVLAEAQLASHDLADSCNLDIRDVVTAAIARNDLKYLVSRVYSRWCKLLPLYIEVSQLRKQYALDWQQDQGLIHVLYGKDGHIVCTLRITSGHVQLVTIEGLKSCNSLDKFMVDRDMSLTEWLEHLNTKIKSVEEKTSTS